MSRKRKQKHVAEGVPQEEILAEGSGPHGEPAPVEANAELAPEHTAEDLAEALPGSAVPRQSGRGRKAKRKAAAASDAPVADDAASATDGDASAERDAALAGGSSLDADTAIAGDASLDTDAALDGDSTLEADAGGDGDAALDGDGDSTLEADAAGDGDAALDSDARLDGDSTLEADASVEADGAPEGDGPQLEVAPDGDSDDDVGPAALPTSAASMDSVQLKQLVEALIFASDKPITIQRLRQLTRVSDIPRLEATLAEITTDYEHRGLILQQVSGGFQFRTRPQFSAWVQQLIQGRPVRLSRAQLETLAIIAYRQPITRPEIDDIRGVDSSATLKLLMDRTLIRILGKKEEVGRPMLYGTTKEFLDFFSLGDLRELPTLREYSELSDESRKVMSSRLGIGLDGSGSGSGGSDSGGSDSGGNDSGGGDSGGGESGGGESGGGGDSGGGDFGGGGDLGGGGDVGDGATLADAAPATDSILADASLSDVASMSDETSLSLAADASPADAGSENATLADDVIDADASDAAFAGAALSDDQIVSDDTSSSDRASLSADASVSDDTSHADADVVSDNAAPGDDEAHAAPSDDPIESDAHVSDDLDAARLDDAIAPVDEPVAFGAAGDDRIDASALVERIEHASEAGEVSDVPEQILAAGSTSNLVALTEDLVERDVAPGPDMAAVTDAALADGERPIEPAAE